MSDSQALSFSAAHPAGLCDVAYIQAADGKLALLTCGPDGKLSYRSAQDPASVAQAVDNTNNGSVAALNCVAPSPKGDRVVVGDEHNFVKVREREGEGADRSVSPWS